jgi:hypothetical protein
MSETKFHTHTVQEKLVLYILIFMSETKFHTHTEPQAKL